MKTELLKSIASAYESQFALNDYKGNILAKHSYEKSFGSIPILLSMPHSVAQMRNGKLKDSDDYTGAIGLFTQKLLDCHCIYSTRTSEEDPNYVIEGKYKIELEKIIKKGNIKFVIDLHGASSKRNFDIDLGTIHGKTMSSNTINEIKEIFSNNGIMNVLENEMFAATHKGTITSFVHHELKVPCFQMEINKKFRDPLNRIDSFKILIASLVDMIHYLNSYHINDLNGTSHEN
ncbi:hypothetical protein [Oceanobacillus damuensis]|uniref:hypothetical protein n=1 Tax=Oceanobacillus damuensis TaxID=937928 RepID=UPI00083262C8|nr:hypothetical protein [Oceanobacillus damuensis]